MAGCEAALQIASRGIFVRLYDMKPREMSLAHSEIGFAELVCSNSLKSENLLNASGILKKELEFLGSVVMESAYANRVEAGGALAVDRHGFSKYITEKIKKNKNIDFICRKVDKIPETEVTVIASGPLTSDELYEDILSKTGSRNLFFFDAASPIVTAESIDMEKAFIASRYDKGEAAYINCPLNEQEYMRFIRFLLEADRVNPRDFENNMVFEGCMPVEIMASRGLDTLRFGPMKPVGLRDPVTGKRPYAVVQLRAEDNNRNLYNLVGFQTNIKFGEQKKLLKLIPGLENAEIVRFGVMHRNSYINSPELLDKKLALRNNDEIFFAGQLTGVEGYLESAATGIMAGIHASMKVLGIEDNLTLSDMSVIGALINFITDGSKGNFQPMNANFGIIRPPEKHIRDKTTRREEMSRKAMETMRNFTDHLRTIF